MKLDLSINRSSSETIVNSFDRIAKELICNWQLNLQGKHYTFTEIEFYYFDKALHPDKYSHKHAYATGKWRFHLQGLDISLGYETEEGSGDFKSYGGILLRGIKSTTEYINGPKRILAHIFKTLDNIEETRKEFGLVKQKQQTTEIFKSYRKGLSERYPEFNRLHYRYFHSISNWDDTHVPPSEKKDIIKNAIRLF